MRGDPPRRRRSTVAVVPDQAQDVRPELRSTTKRVRLGALGDGSHPSAPRSAQQRLGDGAVGDATPSASHRCRSSHPLSVSYVEQSRCWSRSGTGSRVATPQQRGRRPRHRGCGGRTVERRADGAPLHPYSTIRSGPSRSRRRRTGADHDGSAHDGSAHHQQAVALHDRPGFVSCPGALIRGPLHRRPGSDGYLERGPAVQSERPDRGDVRINSGGGVLPVADHLHRDCPAI